MYRPKTNNYILAGITKDDQKLLQPKGNYRKQLLLLLVRANDASCYSELAISSPTWFTCTTATHSSINAGNNTVSSLRLK